MKLSGILSIKFVFSIIACFCFTTMMAGEPLTFEACRQMALERNAQVRTGLNNALSAAETRKAAFTKYFPEVTATGMAFRSNRNMVDIGLMDIIQISFLRKGHAAGVQFVQPIFMGGQIFNGNQLAEVGEAVAELQLRQSRDDVCKTVSQYFYQIAALEAKQQTLEAAQLTVDSLALNVEAALKAGMTTLNDLLEVNLRKSQFRADSVDLENGLSLARMLLAQYIGVDTTSVNIAYTPMTQVPELPLDLYRIPQAAVTQTAAYGLLEQNLQATRLKEKLALGQNLPQVALGGGLYHYDVMDLDRSFGSLFLGVNIPLSAWWGGSHDMKKARLDRANAQIKLENDSELLQLAMRNAWDDVSAAQRKAQIAYEAIDQARENLRIYQAFYDAGTTTITDLLQAQALLRQTQDRFTEAQAQFNVAVNTYLIATAQMQ